MSDDLVAGACELERECLALRFVIFDYGDDCGLDRRLGFDVHHVLIAILGKWRILVSERQEQVYFASERVALFYRKLMFAVVAESKRSVRGTSLISLCTFIIGTSRTALPSISPVPQAAS